MNPFSLCASFFLGLLILSVTSFYAFHKTTHKCDLSCVAVNCYILYENNYDEGECLCFDNDELYCFDKLEKDVDGYAEYTNFCLIIFFSYIGLSMINLICCCLLDNNYYSSNNDRLTINKKLKIIRLEIIENVILMSTGIVLLFLINMCNTYITNPEKFKYEIECPYNCMIEDNLCNCYNSETGNFTFIESKEKKTTSYKNYIRLNNSLKIIIYTYCGFIGFIIIMQILEYSGACNLKIQQKKNMKSNDIASEL